MSIRYPQLILKWVLTDLIWYWLIYRSSPLPNQINQYILNNYIISRISTHINIKFNKKDGYQQRASVSAISLRHILTSPGYAPGTIVVSVTWMKRVFNACQTHCSMYPSTFNRLRAIARYWSEIATFSYPLAFNAPVGGVPIEIPGKFGPQKIRIMGLPGSEDSLTMGWDVSTQYQRVTDRRTDGQPLSITCAVWLTDAR